MSSHISTLLKKDLTLFTRDRFYFLITVVGLVMYFVIYLIMPKTMNETIKIGLYAPGIPEVETIDESLALKEGIDLNVFSTLTELRDAVSRNEYTTAIALPDNFITSLNNGERPVVTVYFAGSAPEELRMAVTAMINELASQASGQTVLLDINTEILGNDLSGKPIPWRDRLIPVMVIFILGSEILSLASLIATELEQKTIKALLVTPLKLDQLLTAKAIIGIGMAFIQVLLFAAIVGGLTNQPFSMILVLFIGSIMVTGLGFLVASTARDMMGVTAWGMIVMVIFVIPAIGAMIPGLLADWAKVLPSFHLTDAISQLVNYGASFSNISLNILVMLVWSAIFTIIGVLALKRQYA
jgi:ABC-2 type transport system permease protein